MPSRGGISGGGRARWRITMIMFAGGRFIGLMRGRGGICEFSAFGFPGVFRLSLGKMGELCYSKGTKADDM